MQSRKASKKRYLKIVIVDGFWSPKWSPKSSSGRRRVVVGTDFVQRSLQDRFQTSFVMLLGAFFDVFGAYFEGFWLDVGAFNLQKMPKDVKYFLLPPRIACLKTSGGRR